MVDEPVVEAVARDAHAGVPEGLGAQLAAPDLEMDHREVGGAAAEVGDQHRGAVLQRLRIEERRRHRLVHLLYAREPERRERRAVALHRELRVGTAAARVLDGTAHQHVARQLVQLRVRVAAQLAEEAVEEVLEAPGGTVDVGLLEEPARGEALERLDEAAVARELDEALDRPRAGVGHRLGMVLVTLVPERERRAEREEPVGEEAEHHGIRARVGMRPREHRVGRAEVEPERARRHLARPRRLSAPPSRRPSRTARAAPCWCPASTCRTARRAGSSPRARSPARTSSTTRS